MRRTMRAVQAAAMSEPVTSYYVDAASRDAPVAIAGTIDRGDEHEW